MAYAVPAVISLIGVAVSTYAQYRSTQQQAAVAEAQGKIYDRSAQMSEQESQSIKESAAFEEAQSRRRTAQIISKQRAITAASGVETTGGSPLLMELDSVRQAEIEALNIRRAGAVASSSKDFEAQINRYQGGISRYQARFRRSQLPLIVGAGAVRAGGSVLGGWAGGGGGVSPYRGGYD